MDSDDFRDIFEEAIKVLKQYRNRRDTEGVEGMYFTLVRLITLYDERLKTMGRTDLISNEPVYLRNF